MISTSVSVWAQQEEDQCHIKPTDIVTLEAPDFKSPVITEFSYKLAGIQNVIDADFAHAAKNKTNQNYILLGNYKNSDNIEFPFLAQLDQKGKVIWHVHETGKYPYQAVDLLKNKYGYVVLGNVNKPGAGRGFYVTQYDRNGKRLRQTPFFTAGDNSYAKAIDFTRDKKGYLVAIDRVDKNDKKSATIFRVNLDGFSPWDKKYALDQDTIFENIQRLQKGSQTGHIITGSIEKADGRYAGWLFNLKNEGSAGWQKEYIRGVNASLHQSIQLSDEGYLLAGQTQSFFGDKKSAWVMKVDRNGKPVWQRFYTGSYDYNIRDMSLGKNGLISVLMAAQPFEGKENKKSHLRLLMLSPRGNLLYNDSFKGADKSFVSKLLKGSSGEHVFIGMKQYVPPKDIQEAQGIKPINEGWILFAPAFENYTDRCVLTKE